MGKKYNVLCPIEEFKCISEGIRTFDIRLNNCKYEVGDVLIEQECNGFGTCTGRAVERKVIYIASLGDVKPLVEHVGTWAGHFVVLGLAAL